MTTAQTQGYDVNGSIVTNLEEVAKLLNVSRVARKDVEEGGKYADQVSLVDLAADDDHQEAPKGDGQGEGQEPSGDNKDAAGDSWEEGYPQGNKDDEEPDDDNKVDVDTSQAISKEQAIALFPEFKELDELKAFITDIDTPTLEYVAKAIGCEWTPTDNAPIFRMRIAQSLHRFFFPDLFQPKETKKKSKYGDLTTDKLVSMAKEHGVKWDKSGNEPIDRMRLIMALKGSGHLAD